MTEKNALAYFAEISLAPRVAPTFNVVAFSRIIFRKMTFSKMTFNRMTLRRTKFIRMKRNRTTMSKMTFYRITLGRMTLTSMRFIRMILSRTTLSRMALSRMTLISPNCKYTINLEECHSANCFSNECFGAPPFKPMMMLADDVNLEETFDEKTFLTKLQT